MKGGEPQPEDTGNGKFTYQKLQKDGMTIYVRNDMKFENDVAEIDRRDYRGDSFLIVRNYREY